MHFKKLSYIWGIIFFLLTISVWSINIFNSDRSQESENRLVRSFRVLGLYMDDLLISSVENVSVARTNIAFNDKQDVFTFSAFLQFYTIPENQDFNDIKAIFYNTLGLITELSFVEADDEFEWIFEGNFERVSPNRTVASETIAWDNYVNSEFMQNHDQSLEYAHNIRSMFPQNKAGEIMYPDDFAGMYINYDGLLVVKIMGDYVTLNYNENSLVRVMPPGVIIETSQFFSYNELRSVPFAFMDFLNSDPYNPLAINIQGIGVNERLNRVTVVMDILSEETIANFNALIEILDLNPKYFIFEEGESKILYDYYKITLITTASKYTP